ncbi:unnamed protein product, partial [Mesorhabditis belari]|uniref:Uncharacterized protein n=1 Tax=Mesorhabditis belari TaxID=2138241 RepID=A0AAF3F301_9BILA
MFSEWKKGGNHKDFAHSIAPAAPPPSHLIYPNKDKENNANKRTPNIITPNRHQKSPLLVVRSTRTTLLRNQQTNTRDFRRDTIPSSKLGPPPHHLLPLRSDSDLSRSPSREPPSYLKANHSSLNSSWSFGSLDKVPSTASTYPVHHSKPWKDPIITRKDGSDMNTYQMETLLALENNLFFANR